MMQRLITQQVVDQKGALYITNALWTLMENNIEEVKVLQTVTLLLTTNTVVHGDTLAKALVLCFRLHYTKNPTIVNTAGATIRQALTRRHTSVCHPPTLVVGGGRAVGGGGLLWIHLCLFYAIMKLIASANEIDFMTFPLVH